MMNAFALALVLFAISAPAVFAAIEDDFQAWGLEHKKTYHGKEAYTYRLGVYARNAAFVEKHNEKGESWEVALNEFADLTYEEFEASYLTDRFNVTESSAGFSARTVVNVDWKAHGYVTPIRKQNCGDCYSFAATAAMEACHKGSSGQLLDLSEQQCLDCSLGFGNMGCSGGWADNCWSYYASVGGQDSEASYPYTGAQGPCQQAGITPVAAVTGGSAVMTTEAALQQSVVSRVTAAAMDASGSAFQLYKTGTYCPTTCSTTQLNHAVTVIGQQTSSPDYYIVKNSWGTTWGMLGYFRICANRSNKCGIASHASYPVGC